MSWMKLIFKRNIIGRLKELLLFSSANMPYPDFNNLYDDTIL
jgi:hypothetical protein